MSLMSILGGPGMRYEPKKNSTPDIFEVMRDFACVQRSLGAKFGDQQGQI
jgi:hypothetical protein